MASKANAGIVQLINKTFAKTFVDESKVNPITFVVGRFSAEGDESVNSDEAKQTLGGAVVGKTIDGEDSFALVAERNDWRSGKVFNAYDPNRENSNHYALVTSPDNTLSVYLCIENGDAYQKGSISTVRPDGNFGTIISSDDGYRWLRLYNITGKFFKFLTSSHIPVPSKDDIDNAPSTSSLKLSNSTLSYWNDLKGRIIRFDIDPAIKELRWDEKPSFNFKQITGDEANINFAFDFDSDNAVTTRRGYSLRDIIILDGGSGYTTSVNNLKLSSDPDKNGTYNLDVDQIVGSKFITGLGKFGPLIKPIITLGNLDFPSILNSDKGMFVAHIDSSEIQKVSNVTNFDSVSLVQNLKHSSGENIETVLGKNTAFRMSDQVTLSTTTGLAVGDTLNASNLSGGTRSTGNKIAAIDTTAKRVELTRGDHKINNLDRLYKINYTTDSGTQKKLNTSVKAARSDLSVFSSSEVPTLGFAVGTTDTISTEIGADASIIQANATSSLDEGEGRFGTDTIPLYTNKLGASDAITQSQGIVFRAIIGGDGVTQI